MEVDNEMFVEEQRINREQAEEIERLKMANSKHEMSTFLCGVLVTIVIARLMRVVPPVINIVSKLA